MRTVVILDGQYPRVDISKAILKCTSKSRNQKQTLRKPVAEKQNTRRGPIIAFLIHKLTFFIPASENTLGLQ